MPVRSSYTLKRKSYGPYTQGTYNLGALSESLDGLDATVGQQRGDEVVEQGAAVRRVAAKLFVFLTVTHDSSLVAR